MLSAGACARAAWAPGAARPAPAAGQRGVTLVESLIALLVFSVGVLGLVALNASSARIGLDARLRTEAALLADDLVARMIASNRATVQADFATGGPRFAEWLAGRVRAPASGLPAGDAAVTFSAVGGEPLSVRIVVTWQPPARAVRDASGAARAESRRRQHVTVTALYD